MPARPRGQIAEYMPPLCRNQRAVTRVSPLPLLQRPQRSDLWRSLTRNVADHLDVPPVDDRVSAFERVMPDPNVVASVEPPHLFGTCCDDPLNPVWTPLSLWWIRP
jgi:hypothetical protein